VRYDSAHGRPHRDTLGGEGAVIDKDWMPTEMSLNAAMNEAKDDLEKHHGTYRTEFMRRKPR
jgi:hypothetical protein